MTISALLSPQNTFVDTEVTSKKKLLELIANIVADRSKLAESTIYSNLLGRERLGSTGLGQGLASGSPSTSRKKPPRSTC